MNVNSQGLWADIKAIQKSAPLVHNITNLVVMDQTANALLALGASPVMAHALEEVEEMASLAKGLVLNIGTLTSELIKGMELAIGAAFANGIPIVLDPAGVGTTGYRRKTARALLEKNQIDLIRGNSSEIVSLYGKGKTKGVDSLLCPIDCEEPAKKTALKKSVIVWMSGKTDLITDGKKVILVHNGSPLMGKVTGMGCTASAVAGAFLAVNKDPLQASAHAAVLMGVAAELAALKVNGPGSFKLAFLDALYEVTEGDLKERMCVEIR